MKHTPNNSKSLTSFIQDANRFVLYNRSILEAAPFQLYASALVFSPLQSKIRTVFGNELPLWIKTFPLVAQDWSPCLLTLATEEEMRVAISADGKRVASG